MKKFLLFCLATLFLFVTTSPVLAQMVMYNTQTHKYHALWCRWAAKCTVNCIKIDKKEAIRRGGVPCKVCGG